MPRAAGWQAGRARLIGTSDALAEDDARAFVVDVRAAPGLRTHHPRAGRRRARRRATTSSAPWYPRPTSAIDRPVAARCPVRPGATTIAKPWPRPTCSCSIIPGRLSDERSLPRWRAGSGVAGRSFTSPASRPMRQPEATRRPGRHRPPAAGRIRAPARRRQSQPRGSSPTSAETAAVRASSATRSRRLLPRCVLPARWLRTRCPMRWPTTCAPATATAAPAWSSRRCGAGTLAILNADLGASNLPTSSAFVPLIGELTSAPARTSGSIGTGRLR